MLNICLLVDKSTDLEMTTNEKHLHLQLQWKFFTAQEKSVMWQLSQQTLSWNQWYEKKRF